MRPIAMAWATASRSRNGLGEGRQQDFRSVATLAENVVQGVGNLEYFCLTHQDRCGDYELFKIDEWHRSSGPLCNFIF